MSITFLILCTILVGGIAFIRQRNVAKRESNIDTYLPPSIGW